MLLARAVMALAFLLAAVSVMSCALALATDGGSCEDWNAGLSSLAAAAAVFRPLEDFSACGLDFRCASVFRCELCLTTGVAALSVSSAACEGPAAQIQSPAANTNAARPLAFMVILHLPKCQPLDAKEPSSHVRSGAKKGNLRGAMQKRENGITSRSFRREPPADQPHVGPDVSRTERCYEPCSRESWAEVLSRQTIIGTRNCASRFRDWRSLA